MDSFKSKWPKWKLRYTLAMCYIKAGHAELREAVEALSPEFQGFTPEGERVLGGWKKERPPGGGADMFSGRSASPSGDVIYWLRLLHLGVRGLGSNLGSFTL